MTTADFTLMAFTLCNSLRVLAYVPQIWKAAIDDGGAKAISYTTWTLFLISHLTTAAYAVTNKNDAALALMFLMNAAGCAAILAVASLRRNLHKRSQSQTSAEVVRLNVRRAA